MRKPKQTKDETPANDAGSDVAGPLEPAPPVNYFTQGENQLPDVPDDGNRIGRLADVFALSGYWPHLTPAKIAVQILAGETIGLAPASAMFDLQIAPGDDGPTVRWTRKQPLQATGDEILNAKIEGQRTAANDAMRKLYDRPSDPAPKFEPPPADLLHFQLPDRGTVTTDLGDLEIKNGDNVTIDGDGTITVRPGDPDVTVAEAIAAADLIDAARSVIDLPPNLAEKLERGESIEPADFFQDPENANKGVLSDRKSDAAETTSEGVPAIPGPGSGEMAAESAATNDAELEMPPFPIADAINPPSALDIATPDPTSEARGEQTSVAAIGELDVKGWRTAIDTYFHELEFTEPRISESLKKYDAADLKQKGELFEQAAKFYRLELEKGKTKILNALAADGKKTLDEMFGFFLFADLDGDPDKWTVADVKKGLKALAEFGLAADPPPEIPLNTMR
jgi:hypothetical protein